MAPAGWRRSVALIEELWEHPTAFEFAQAVRILEARERERSNGSARESVGGDGDPCREVVRFRCDPDLAFPGSEVVSLTEARRREDEPEEAASRPPELEVGFFGLIGAMGVLPQPYSELVLSRLVLKDRGLAAFLDVFHHRAVSLFYRAWKKYRLPVRFEPSLFSPGKRDDATRALASLVGIGTKRLENRQSFHDHVWIFYAGHFATRPRTAIGLACLLEEYLGETVRLESFVGRWLKIPESDRSTLGGDGALGESFVIGERYWDVQSRVKLHIGPLRFERYSGLLPGGAIHRRVAEIARSYLGVELECDLELELCSSDRNVVRLGEESERAPLLGWTSWLAATDSAEVNPQVPMPLTQILADTAAVGSY